MKVAGVDGARGGWVVATRDGVRLVPAIEAVLGAHEVVGVDMPIGLPPAWGRSADIAARRFLGTRACTVFPTPPRALLACGTYAEANDEARRRYGKGLQQQAWHLIPRIRELDALMTPALERRVAEIHPECSFATMAGHVLAPKRSADGRNARRQLVEAAFGAVPARLPGAAEHDVLDAYAVLWSAERFASGGHVVLGDGERDERGLVMRIVR